MDAVSFHSACDVLRRLREAGIEVEPDGSSLRCRPRLPDGLRPRVVAWKAEILSLLSGDEAEAFRAAGAGFGTAGLAFPIRSGAVGQVVFVSDESLAREAYAAGLVPYTAGELRTIAADGRDALEAIHEAKLELIHEAKRVFGGILCRGGNQQQGQIMEGATAS
jgi:hypothetical protein